MNVQNNLISLPVKYNKLSKEMKRKVRQQYIREQNNLCYHCKGLIHIEPPFKINIMKINKKLFPKGFFSSHIHLHHSHKTGLTIGTVHAKCNAVLFQYYGE